MSKPLSFELSMRCANWKSKARSISMNHEPANMQLNNAIMFSLPVRDIRLSTASGTDAAQCQRDAERAAYERGRRDGEKALSEQLLAQRSEILELHQGIL